jgi:hypothetical protein
VIDTDEGEAGSNEPVETIEIPPRPQNGPAPADQKQATPSDRGK